MPIQPGRGGRRSTASSLKRCGGDMATTGAGTTIAIGAGATVTGAGTTTAIGAGITVTGAGVIIAGTAITGATGKWRRRHGRGTGWGQPGAELLGRNRCE